MSIKSALLTIFTLGKGTLKGLPDSVDNSDPIEMFREWLGDAENAGLLLPEAATLATSSSEGSPSARMVLLKEVDQRGFVFYTNYTSRKGAEIDANPRAAMVFYWPSLQRQVRVEGGVVERLSVSESEVYFQSRARGSRIGAWASKQSQVLSGREELTRRFEQYAKRFEGENVPLPDFWGGYRVIPQRIEFWQGRTNRLHDRIEFVRNTDGWSSQRLHP